MRETDPFDGPENSLTGSVSSSESPSFSTYETSWGSMTLTSYHSKHFSIYIPAARRTKPYLWLPRCGSKLLSELSSCNLFLLILVFARLVDVHILQADQGVLILTHLFEVIVIVIDQRLEVSLRERRSGRVLSCKRLVRGTLYMVGNWDLPISSRESPWTLRFWRIFRLARATSSSSSSESSSSNPTPRLRRAIRSLPWIASW